MPQYSSHIARIFANGREYRPGTGQLNIKLTNKISLRTNYLRQTSGNNPSSVRVEVIPVYLDTGNPLTSVALFPLVSGTACPDTTPL